MSLYSGGGAYNWNEVSVSICGGLIFGGVLYSGGGAYSRRFTVCIQVVVSRLHDRCCPKCFKLSKDKVVHAGHTNHELHIYLAQELQSFGQ